MPGEWIVKFDLRVSYRLDFVSFTVQRKWQGNFPPDSTVTAAAFGGDFPSMPIQRDQKTLEGTMKETPSDPLRKLEWTGETYNEERAEIGIMKMDKMSMNQPSSSGKAAKQTTDK